MTLDRNAARSEAVYCSEKERVCMDVMAGRSRLVTIEDDDDGDDNNNNNDDDDRIGSLTIDLMVWCL